MFDVLLTVYLRFVERLDDVQNAKRTWEVVRGRPADTTRFFFSVCNLGVAGVKCKRSVTSVGAIEAKTSKMTA